jgi:CelD/BcsL family acetyltransferase involved in cellulose biosynthesis
VRTRIFTSAGEVDEGIAHYDLVHRASWKRPERFGRFPEGLMRAAAEAGALRLGVLYVDGRPVATEVGIVAGGRASMVKTAYDEQYAPHSVGALVMMDVMRHVVDVDGALEVDFGVDDAPYKRLWLSRRRERWGLVSFNPRSAGGVRSLTRHLLGQAATCLARSVRPAVAAATRRLARVTVRSGRP